MTWTAHARRAEVLRAVLAAADTRRDGLLPMDLPGVMETFGDELSLLAALQLRWHTRLAGTIERELMDQPLDLESAVSAAWRATAAELAGVEAILTNYHETPSSAATAEMLAKSRRKDWAMLAVMAGKASLGDPRAPDVGCGIEERARTVNRPRAQVHQGASRSTDTTPSSLLRRVKAHLAA